MEIEQWIQSWNNSILDNINIKISFIGETDFFILLFLILFYFIGRREAIKAGSIFFFSKDIFRIPRAFGQLNIRVVGASEISGFSFPSGHVQNTATMSGMFTKKINKYLASACFLLLTILVAYSRIYLAAHTICDWRCFIRICDLICRGVSIFEKRRWSYALYLSYAGHPVSMHDCTQDTKALYISRFLYQYGYWKPFRSSIF